MRRVHIDYRPEIQAALDTAAKMIVDAMIEQPVNTHMSHVEGAIETDSGEPVTLGIFCLGHRTEAELRDMMRLMLDDYCKWHYPPTAIDPAATN